MRKYVSILAFLAIAHPSAAQASADKELGAIWFLGDSITQSNTDSDASGSPRKSLYNLLTTNGYRFSYTGHHALNVDGLPSSGEIAADNLYHYHSGISGSIIGEDIVKRVGMTENLSRFWTSGRLSHVKPDIILIMLGTNDIGKAYNVVYAPARLKTLVETIYDLPSVGLPKIYLASIPPNGREAPQPANVLAFNAAIPGIVADFQSDGKEVYFVDQFTPLNADYANAMRGDNLHPNATGNALMARAWFDAITSSVHSD
ncbi:MAG: GDSL-type esterase/lipase family protein [Lentimonas sp.]